MDTLLQFWHKYCPEVDPYACDFLLQHGQRMLFDKGQVIKRIDQPLASFCIVLSGLVAGFEAGDAGADQLHPYDPQLRELILPMDYFSGPAHVFSRRNRPIEYRAISHSTLLQIPLQQARLGQLHYPDLAELFQVMKQRKINRLRQQVELYQERDHYLRYCLYRRLLPDWAYLLPRDIQCQFLQMSKTHFHRIKDIYLHNHP